MLILNMTQYQKVWESWLFHMDSRHPTRSLGPNQQERHVPYKKMTPFGKKTFSEQIQIMHNNVAYVECNYLSYLSYCQVSCDEWAMVIDPIMLIRFMMKSVDLTNEKMTATVVPP